MIFQKTNGFRFVCQTDNLFKNRRSEMISLHQIGRRISKSDLSNISEPPDRFFFEFANAVILVYWGTK